MKSGLISFWPMCPTPEYIRYHHNNAKRYILNGKQIITAFRCVVLGQKDNMTCDNNVPTSAYHESGTNATMTAATAASACKLLDPDVFAIVTGIRGMRPLV